MFLYTMSRGKEALLKKIIGFFWLWCFVLVQSVCLTNIARGVEQNECNSTGCACAAGYCLAPKNSGGSGNPKLSWCKKCVGSVYDSGPDKWRLSSKKMYCMGNIGYDMPDPDDDTNCKGIGTCPGDKVGKADYSGCECPAGKYNSSGNTCTVCQTGKYREAGSEEACMQCHMAGYYGTTRPGNAANLHDNKNDCVIEVIFNGNGGDIKNGGSGLINPTVYAEYVPEGQMKMSCYFQDRNAADQPVGDPVSLCRSTQYGFKVTDGVDGTPTRFSYNNHTFAGWYTGSDFNHLVHADDVFPGKAPDDVNEFNFIDNNSTIELRALWCKTDEHWVAENGKCICIGGYIQQGSVCADCPEGRYCRQGEHNAKSCSSGLFPHSDPRSDDIYDCYAKLTLKIDTDTVVLRVNSFYIPDFNSAGPGHEEATCDIATTGTPLVTADDDKGCMLHMIDNSISYYVNPSLAPTNIQAGSVFEGWYKDQDLIQKLAYHEDFKGDLTLHAKIVCKQGYYKASGGCQPCPAGKTTATVGATSSDECKTAFKYGDNKFWTWPSGVEEIAHNHP